MLEYEKKRKICAAKEIKTGFFLRGEKIVLRSLKESDADSIYALLRDNEVRRYIPQLPCFCIHKYSSNLVRKIMQEHKKPVSQRSKHVFGIALKKNNELIGVIALFNIRILKQAGVNSVDIKTAKKHIEQSAEIGFWLGKKYWGKGFAREALQLMLKFSFRKLGLRKVCARVLRQNTKAIRLLECAGFKQVGLHRNVLFKCFVLLKCFKSFLPVHYCISREELDKVCE